ncbi:MAG: precorrin-6A reductase [Nitrospinae bacterium]|nr:precorrin-6A reductase [Nitrospinota bacterium]
MILLLGGTSETAGLATALAAAGWRTLVSTATDNALDVGNHPLIERRMGRMAKDAMAALARKRGVTVIVDATHPYAREAKGMIAAVAQDTGLPLISFLRAGNAYNYERIHYVKTHDEAAVTAFSFGKPVLLTTGSRNLAPYARERSKSGIRLVARVLPHPESAAACAAAGLADEEVITGRGPFTVEENIAVIRQYGIGTLVTKESGDAGGVPEKIEAARREGCHVVIVDRPEPSAENACGTVDEVVDAVRRIIGNGNG